MTRSNDGAPGNATPEPQKPDSTNTVSLGADTNSELRAKVERDLYDDLARPVQVEDTRGQPETPPDDLDSTIREIERRWRQERDSQTEITRLIDKQETEERLTAKAVVKVKGKGNEKGQRELNGQPPVNATGASVPSCLDGVAVLDMVEHALRRYVAFASDAQAVAVTLWIAVAHAYDVFDYSPRLAIMAPTMRCGKSSLLDAIELHVPRPMKSSNATVATIFRSIEKYHPTLLIDEIDTVFGRHKKDGSEDLRGLIDSGYRRGGLFHRCVGDGAKLDVKDFKVFAPVAMAGIGKLPATIMDRSVLIELQRMAPGQAVEKLRSREAEAAAAPVFEALAAWTEVHRDALGDARPPVPPALNARQQDSWEPLLAVAELAGGAWPDKATAAAVVLSNAPADDEDRGVRLLADIRCLFEQRDADKLSSGEVVDALNALEGAPWPDWRVNGLTKNALAHLLKPFKVRPGDIWEGGDAKRAVKGYHRGHFTEAWARYLDSPSSRPSKREDAIPQVKPTIPASSVRPDTDRKPLLTSTLAVSRVNHREEGGSAVDPDPDGRRAGTSEIAEVKGYPVVKLAASATVGGSRERWELFVSKARLHELQEAYDALVAMEDDGRERT